jgi:predicted RNase H-like HicB family nuclease
MTFKGTVKIAREEDWCVATCLENDIASQGKTIDEALENLQEAIALYYEDEDNREELSFYQSEPVYITRLEMAL